MLGAAVRRQSGVLLALFFFGVALVNSSGAAGDAQSIRSRSGQFIVRGLPADPGRVINSPAPSVPAALISPNSLRLEPSVLAVTCEQVKQALLRELSMPDEWRGIIHVDLYPLRDKQEWIRIVSVRYSDGWGYHLELSEQLDRERLFRGLVEVLLREIATRRAAVRQPELPFWLVEGFTAHLQSLHPGSLTLSSDTRIVSSGRRPDPLDLVRNQLRTNQVLTLNELSWPTAAQVADPDRSGYRACSHLLLAELLRLKNGRACFGDLLLHLPQFLNWQSAFLRAYDEHFPSLMTFDKWWTLVAINFSGREQMFLWGGPATLQQMQDILTATVQVRLANGDLPILTHVKLQNLVAEGDYESHAAMLLQKANHLQALRWRSPAEYIPLIDGYREALISYVEKRRKIHGPNPGRKALSSAARSVVSETVKSLDRLDAERTALDDPLMAATGDAPLAAGR